MKLTRNAVRQAVHNSNNRSNTKANKTNPYLKSSTVEKAHNVVTPDKKRKSSNHEDTIETLKKEICVTPTLNLSDLDCSQQDSASSSTNKQKLGNNEQTSEGML